MNGFLTVQEGREPDDDADLFVSQTAIGQAQLCGGRLGYRAYPGYNYTPTEAMSFGTMVHAMAETDLHTVVGPDGPFHEWSRHDVEDLWAEGLRNERDGSFNLYALASRERIDKSVEEAMFAHNQWRAEVLPTLGEPASNWEIEKRVYKQLGTLPTGKAVWFAGTADLVMPDVPFIIDWKTAGRGWDESKAAFTPQATYYSWLYGIYHHRYWVWNRRSKDWTMFETSRTDEHIDAALRVAWQVVKGMYEGTLVPNPLQDTFGKMKRGWHCAPKYCGAWDICEYKYVNDNVWEGTPIEVKAGWTL